jgi:hypothetical protein
MKKTLRNSVSPHTRLNLRPASAREDLLAIEPNISNMISIKKMVILVQIYDIGIVRVAYQQVSQNEVYQCQFGVLISGPL